MNELMEIGLWLAKLLLLLFSLIVMACSLAGLVLLLFGRITATAEMEEPQEGNSMVRFLTNEKHNTNKRNDKWKN